MKISLEKLESLLNRQSGMPRCYESYREDIFEQAMPALYIASRSGEIDVLDLLIACREHTEMTRMIARNCHDETSIEDVKTVLDVISRDVPEYVNRIQENYVLEDWLKRVQK